MKQSNIYSFNLWRIPVVQLCCGLCMQVEKNFLDLKQGVEKTSLLRQETLLTQWADFLIIRESGLGAWACLFLEPKDKGSARSGLVIHL